MCLSCLIALAGRPLTAMLKTVYRVFECFLIPVIQGELDKLEEQNKEIRYQLRDLAMDVRRTQDEMTDNHKTLCRHYSVASLDEDAK